MAVMRFMVFTDKMVDGVAAIDQQHARLVDVINELYEIALTKNASITLDKVFEELGAATARHFEEEEKLLADRAYPRLKEHHAQHEALKRQIADYRATSHSASQTIIAADMLYYLKQWLNHHMVYDDKDACRYLNARGIH